MPTPDWEEWLRRQDFDIEDTTTVDKYTKMLEEELGIHGGSLDIAKDIYGEKYDVFPALGIHSFEWRGTVRYGIEGYAGAWGRESALNIGIEKAEFYGFFETASLLTGWKELEFGGD